jgi:hypothetical protein
MSEKGIQYLAGIGIKLSGDDRFRTRSTARDQCGSAMRDQLRPQEPPRSEPYVIHGGPGKSRCSVCCQPVSIPPGTCGTCLHCGAQFGGCG